MMAGPKGTAILPVLLLLLLPLVCGCLVIGGDDGTPVTPPSEDLTGSYELYAFDIYYYSDSRGTIPADHLTEYDYSSYGGFMSIDLYTPAAGTIQQLISRNEIYDVDWSGTFVVSAPALFFVTPTSGDPFNLSVIPGPGYDLFTQTQMYYDGGRSLYYTEIDYWTKYDDLP